MLDGERFIEARKAKPYRFKEVSQLLRPDKDREVWFSLEENHEKAYHFCLNGLRNFRAVALDVWAAIIGVGDIFMVTASYESALQLAVSLSREEQLRLIQELTAAAVNDTASKEQTSVLALCGLGQEIWQQVDAQEYVRRERSSWNG
jgi:hypothetical protein